VISPWVVTSSTLRSAGSLACPRAVLFEGRNERALVDLRSDRDSSLSSRTSSSSMNARGRAVDHIGTSLIGAEVSAAGSSWASACSSFRDTGSAIVATEVRSRCDEVALEGAPLG